MCSVAGQGIFVCVQKWKKVIFSMLYDLYSFHLVICLNTAISWACCIPLLYCLGLEWHGAWGVQEGLVIQCPPPAHCSCYLKITGTVNVFASPPHLHPPLLCEKSQ